MRKEIEEKARGEGQAIVERARAEIERERERFLAVQLLVVIPLLQAVQQLCLRFDLTAAAVQFGVHAVLDQLADLLVIRVLEHRLRLLRQAGDGEDGSGEENTGEKGSFGHVRHSLLEEGGRQTIVTGNPRRGATC